MYEAQSDSQMTLDWQQSHFLSGLFTRTKRTGIPEGLDLEPAEFQVQKADESSFGKIIFFLSQTWVDHAIDDQPRLLYTDESPLTLPDN